MKKILLILTLFFAHETKAAPSEADTEAAAEVLAGVVVLAGMVAIAAYRVRQSKGIGSSEYIYFDENSKSIIFSEETGLQNLEINFSNQISQDFFQTNSLNSSDNLYLGFKYRY